MRRARVLGTSGRDPFPASPTDMRASRTVRTRVRRVVHSSALCSPAGGVAPGPGTGRPPQDGRLRGDVSPGYTSPDHPGVADRIADVAPNARLVYLVRDPLGISTEEAFRQIRATARQQSTKLILVRRRVIDEGSTLD